MIWICDAPFLGESCGCCRMEVTDAPPDVRCARNHQRSFWRRADDDKKCRCWMGVPLPGQQPC